MYLPTLASLRKKITKAQHRIKLIAWSVFTYENPRRFSIQLLFAKLRAKPRNKPYTSTLATRLKTNKPNRNFNKPYYQFYPSFKRTKKSS
mgnify:CR=1 FL=1